MRNLRNVNDNDNDNLFGFRIQGRSPVSRLTCGRACSRSAMLKQAYHCSRSIAAFRIQDSRLPLPVTDTHGDRNLSVATKLLREEVAMKGAGMLEI